MIASMVVNITRSARACTRFGVPFMHRGDFKLVNSLTPGNKLNYFNKNLKVGHVMYPVHVVCSRDLEDNTYHNRLSLPIAQLHILINQLYA